MKNDTAANIYRLFAIFATILSSAFLLFDWIEAPSLGGAQFSVFEITDLLDSTTKYIPISWLKYSSILFKTLLIIALIENAFYILSATLFHKTLDSSPSFWSTYILASCFVLAMLVIGFDIAHPTFNCLFTIVFAIAATCCYHKFNELSKDEDNIEDDLEDYYACPNCGGDVLETTNFCPNCGCDVRIYAPENETKNIKSSVICPNCGNEILKESKFCQFCGLDRRNNAQNQTPIPPHYRNVQNPQAPVHNTTSYTYEPVPAPAPAPTHTPSPACEPISTLTCPSCGSTVSAGSSFCNRCGAKL